MRQFSKYSPLRQKIDHLTESTHASMMSWVLYLSVYLYGADARTQQQAVVLANTYIQEKKVERGRLQLVCAACVIISTKCNDDFPTTTLNEMVYHCAKSFTEKDLRDMEVSVLQHFDFSLEMDLPVDYTDAFYFTRKDRSTAALVSNVLMSQSREISSLPSREIARLTAQIVTIMGGPEISGKDLPSEVVDRAIRTLKDPRPDTARGSCRLLSVIFKDRIRENAALPHYQKFVELL